MVYAAVLEVKKANIDHPDWTAQAVENLVFKDTFFWFPLSLALGLALAAMAFRRSANDKKGAR